jgi:sporulation protein YlmC with PRC-barrel domain
MKNVKRLNRKVLIATVCVAASGWLTAQGQQGSIGQPDPSRQPQLQEPATTTSPDQPMLMVNKCSKLVGSKVKDPQGELLGKIADVIVDFDTGRVSYCALKVKESGFGEAKYLAVPLAALHPSVDGLYLILNADKQKVAQAKGFNRNDWPSVNNPAWGAQPFWQPTSPANRSQDQYIAPGAGPDLNPSTPPPATAPPPHEDKNVPPETIH